MNWLYVAGGLLLVLGAILLVSSLASRFKPSQEVPLSVESAYCPLCQLTLRPGDRASHDRVCAGLLTSRRSKGARTTVVAFHENGQIKVATVRGAFAMYGREMSEVTYEGGPEGLRRALEQVGEEMGEEGA